MVAPSILQETIFLGKCHKHEFATVPACVFCSQDCYLDCIYSIISHKKIFYMMVCVNVSFCICIIIPERIIYS